MNKKKEIQKPIESIHIRLNKKESDSLNKYAVSQNCVSAASAITKILNDNGCFDYDISDDIYINLLKAPEVDYVTNQRIPKSELRIVRCRLTKQQKKSLFYLALEKHKTSLPVFVKNTLKAILFDSALSQKNNDILVKKMWVNVSEETKKELVAEYLKSQTMSTE